MYEFRQLERERESDNDWNPLDGALQAHARILYASQTGDGPPRFDDAESHQRVEQAHADIEGQWFSAADEVLRHEAAEWQTMVHSGDGGTLRCEPLRDGRRSCAMRQHSVTRRISCAARET